jgi:beta-glucosidase
MPKCTSRNSNLKLRFLTKLTDVKTIVSIHNAGTRLVDRWIDHENITAVLFAHLPGQDSGKALVSVMYGDQAPSGRLPYTVAKNESDYGQLLAPVTADNASNYYTSANFTEGVYIDYRHFDAHNITPRYEFGFGLTYTTFEYANLEISVTEIGKNASALPPTAPILEGGKQSLWDVLVVVEADISNTGSVGASEVAQLYLGIPDAPAKQLRGFEKIPLDAGEASTAIFELTRRDLSVWDTVQQDWVLQSEEYTVYVGASSRDVRLTGSLLL